MKDLIGEVVKCEDGIKRIIIKQYTDSCGSILIGEKFTDYINNLIVIDNKTISEIIKENEQLKKK